MNNFSLPTVLIAGVLMILPLSAQSSDQTGSAYDYSFTTLRGEQKLELSQFKGKALLLVNTASKCGFTPQYTGLQALYDKYKDRGLVVLGVPSNDFGAQEPGGPEEIAKFCKLNYGVTFPMTSKTAVSGEAAHPFYKWASSTLGAESAPKWNFHKYLVDPQGKLVSYFHSNTEPGSEKLTQAIEAALP